MIDSDSDEYYKKFFNHFVNGLTHNLILWIISKEEIHGYGIIKKLNEGFDLDDDLKIKPSKIYPILKKMEENEVIIGEWKVNNNKRVKYYSITQKGEDVIEVIQKHISQNFKNPFLRQFILDMAGVEI